MKVSYFKLITDTNCSSEIDIDVLLERIQKDENYFKIAEARILKPRNEKPVLIHQTLFE